MELFFKNMFNFAPHFFRGNSSVGRASASQAEGRGFESRFPLLQSCLKSDFRMAFFVFWYVLGRFWGECVFGGSVNPSPLICPNPGLSALRRRLFLLVSSSRHRKGGRPLCTDCAGLSRRLWADGFTSPGSNVLPDNIGDKTLLETVFKAAICQKA